LWRLRVVWRFMYVLEKLCRILLMFLWLYKYYQ